MELIWVGDTCFRLRGKDAIVICDPPRAAGLTIGRGAVDLVTFSAADYPREAIARLEGAPAVLDGPGEYEVHGVFVTGVRTSPPRAPAAQRNTAYVLTVDDITVCHLGRLANVLSNEQTQLMRDVDVLLIPVGAAGTISPSQAAEVISQVEPKLVVPMGFSYEEDGSLPEGIGRFLREMGGAQTEPQQRINVTHSSLPSEPTVVLMTPRG